MKILNLIRVLILHASVPLKYCHLSLNQPKKKWRCLIMLGQNKGWQLPSLYKTKSKSGPKDRQTIDGKALIQKTAWVLDPEYKNWCPIPNTVKQRCKYFTLLDSKLRSLIFVQCLNMHRLGKRVFCGLLCRHWHFWFKSIS